MDALEAVAKDDDAEGRAGAIARRTSMAVLRDLDASLLERPVVGDLLKLGSANEARALEEQLDTIHERLAEWIVSCESPEEVEAEGWEATPKHATLRLRRLRALLHLVDGPDPPRHARHHRRQDGGGCERDEGGIERVGLHSAEEDRRAGGAQGTAARWRILG